MSFFTFVGVFICLGIPAYIILGSIWCWLFGEFIIRRGSEDNNKIVYHRKNGRRIV